MRSEASDRTVGLLDSADAVPTLPGAFAELAELEHRLGDWPAAHASALGSLRAAQSAGLGVEVMTSLARLASIEAGLGRSSDCRRHAAQAIELSRHHGCKAVEALAGEAVGLLELGLGRIDAAIERLEQVARICAEHPDARAAATSWAHDLAEAYVRRGDEACARRSVARIRELAGRSRSCALAAALERSQAMLATDDAFEELFQRALAWNARTQQPFEQARTQLCFGERLRRAGRAREAQAHLSAALDTFRALGARTWAARARSELVAADHNAGKDSEIEPSEDGSSRLRRRRRRRFRGAAVALTAFAGQAR
jgi:tetratricopeptide (TPR) repeat protein